MGGAGGPAFKLQKPPQMRVPRPSRRRRAGTTTAYTTGGVERTGVAPAESPTLAKNARMGHPPSEWCNAKMGHPPLHGSVGRKKIGGANASGAQLSNKRKAGAASVSMVTAKVGQPPRNI